MYSLQFKYIYLNFDVDISDLQSCLEGTFKCSKFLLKVIKKDTISGYFRLYPV